MNAREKYETFYRAIENSDVETVKRMLLEGVAVNKNEEGYISILMDPLTAAVEYGNLEICNILLNDTRIDPCRHNYAAVRNAVVENNIPIFNMFIQDSRVIESIQNPHCQFLDRSISYTSLHGHYDILVKLLEQRLANPSSDNNISMINSIDARHHKISNLLFRDQRVYSTFDPFPEIQNKINQISMIKDRLSEVCFALQDLELPALITLKIINALIPNNIPMHSKWDLITKIKHFHPSNFTNSD